MYEWWGLLVCASAQQNKPLLFWPQYLILPNGDLSIKYICHTRVPVWHSQPGDIFQQCTMWYLSECTQNPTTQQAGYRDTYCLAYSTNTHRKLHMTFSTKGCGKWDRSLCFLKMYWKALLRRKRRNLLEFNLCSPLLTGVQWAVTT